VRQDATFEIPRLAAMTWTIQILDPTKEDSDPGHVTAIASAVVRGGETTRIELVVTSP
jgi:hypothetical protein